MLAEQKRKRISLYDSQQEAADQIMRFLSGHEKMHLLTGHAGTGKTTVLGYCVAEYAATRRMPQIAVCAVSHKATRNASCVLDSWRVKAETMTCCKLLGLKPEIDADSGKQVFVPDPYEAGASAVDSFDLIIIDECSMVGDSLWGYLMDQVGSLFCQTKLLFVGDPAQLKPVNEPTSPTFTQVPKTNHAHLSEVVRYGGQLGLMADRVRNDLSWIYQPVIDTGWSDELDEGVFLFNQDEFNTAIVRAFTSDRFARDSDSARVLCYRNRTVAAYNAMIHRAIYGANAPLIVEGMRVIANKPFMRGKTTAFPTSAEGTIARLWTGKVEGIPCWYADLDMDYEPSVHGAPIISDEGRPIVEQRLRELKEKRQWREFYRILGLFADVGPLYASTVHRSQGSTFNDAFVVTSDLLSCHNEDERRQLAYVAFTRASDRVICLGG